MSRPSIVRGWIDDLSEQSSPTRVGTGRLVVADVNVCEHWKKSYDDYYATSDPEWRRLGAIDKADNVVRLCASLAGGTVLEIGSGDGAVLSQLADLGFGESYCSLEISTSAVEAISRRRIPGLIECGLYDGYRIPYDRSFDLVILSHVVEHLEHPRALLCEAARVGKNVFIEVPLEDNLRLSEDYVPDPVGHINVYSRRSIRHLIQTSGFEVLEQIVTNPSKEVHRYRSGAKGVLHWAIKDALIRVMPRLATTFFTYHSAALCIPRRSQRSKDIDA